MATEFVMPKLGHLMEEGTVGDWTKGIGDAIKNGRIHLIINTPVGKLSKHDDSYIRKAAIKFKVPYITTTAAAAASNWLDSFTLQ